MDGRSPSIKKSLPIGNYPNILVARTARHQKHLCPNLTSQRDIAVAMINRTPPCHSRLRGNPSAR